MHSQNCLISCGRLVVLGRGAGVIMRLVDTQYHRRRVLFLRTGFSVTDRRIYDGIYGYGKAHRWQIQSVNTPSTIDCGETLSGGGDLKRLDALLAFWKPDGCVAMWDVCRPFCDPENFGCVPVVYCDAIPDSMSKKANVVSIDSKAVADCAARELLGLGLESFAYVSHPGNMAWCEERKKCFRETIELNGKQFAAARLPRGNASSSVKKSFSRWLAGLPRPLGVFAANDDVAEEVVSLCVQTGLSVPKDVAIVGVDNDEMLCENAAVSITSVMPDFRKAGWMAAQLLDELMGSPKTSEVRCFGIGGIARRESTRIVNASDSRIMKSLEYIRRHACDGIGTVDVVKFMGCSRSYANSRFSKIVGWPILREIRMVKIGKVKELLRNTRQPMAAISDMCGFSSCDDMRRTFRQFEGCSPSEWRRAAEGGVAV